MFYYCGYFVIHQLQSQHTGSVQVYNLEVLFGISHIFPDSGTKMFV